MLRYGSLYEAMEAMDVSGIGRPCWKGATLGNRCRRAHEGRLKGVARGFVSQEVFVKRLLAEGYCVSEFEVSLRALDLEKLRPRSSSSPSIHGARAGCRCSACWSMRPPCHAMPWLLGP